MKRTAYCMSIFSILGCLSAKHIIYMLFTMGGVSDWKDILPTFGPCSVSTDYLSVQTGKVLTENMLYIGSILDLMEPASSFSNKSSGSLLPNSEVRVLTVMVG